MSEYIEKQAAQAVLCDACGNAACPRGLIPRCSYYERMQDIPPADVRPVVRGKWIVKTDSEGKTYGVCSRCGYEQYAGHLKYCPECGGKMDGPNQ